MNPDKFNQLVDQRIREIIPPRLMEVLAAWNAAGQMGPIHVPSTGGSNSSFNPPKMVVTPPAPFLLGTSTPPSAAVLDNAATGALVSTRAELDAITQVTNQLVVIFTIFLSYAFMTAIS